jgi:hypothetical protein
MQSPLYRSWIRGSPFGFAPHHERSKAFFNHFFYYIFCVKINEKRYNVHLKTPGSPLSAFVKTTADTSWGRRAVNNTKIVCFAALILTLPATGMMLPEELHAAARHGDVAMVRMLMERNAPLVKKDMLSSALRVTQEELQQLRERLELYYVQGPIEAERDTLDWIERCGEVCALLTKQMVDTIHE